MSEYPTPDAPVQAVPPQVSSANDDRINLLALAVVLAKRKRLIVGVTFGAALIAVVISLLLPKTYTGVGRILPPQQMQTSIATSLLAQFGGLAGLAEGGLGIRNAADLYTGILKSDTVANALIARFRLQNVYDKDTLFDTREKLRKLTTFTPGRDGIIVIAVEDREPKRSAEMANAYIDELQKLTSTLALTEAAQRREFYEKQLKTAGDELARAEIALKETQQETGVIKLDDQSRAIIENIARLRGMLTAKEIQLTALRTFSTDQNPDYRRVLEETATLRAQLVRLEGNAGTSLKGDIFVPTGRVPEAGLKYLSKVRDLKYHETMFELLAKQFEIAKIDEAHDSSRVQIIDRAIVPDKRTSPKRAIIVVVSTMLALLLAMLLAYALESLERARRDPQRLSQLEKIRNYLRSW